MKQTMFYNFHINTFDLIFNSFYYNALCSLQLPVPMFLPVTMDSAERIVETIQEIKEKIPPDPFEAELILMAEMVAEDNEKNSKGQSPKNKVVEKKNEKRESPAPCGEGGILNSCFKRITNMLTLLGKENFFCIKSTKTLPFLIYRCKRRIELFICFGQKISQL